MVEFVKCNYCDGRGIKIGSSLLISGKALNHYDACIICGGTGKLSAMVEMVKPIRDTKKFNKNQKCWILNKPGDLSLRVIGKFRGKGRYIVSWLHENDYREIKEIEVTKRFYNFIQKHK